MVKVPGQNLEAASSQEMSTSTTDLSNLLGLLLMAQGQQQQSVNPLVLARIKEDEFIDTKGKEDTDMIQNCVFKIDSDGDVIILFETYARRYCFIVILESSNGTIGWKEAQLLKTMVDFSKRGTTCNNEMFLKLVELYKSKFQAVECGMNSDRRLACKVKPGAGGLQDVAGKIVQTTVKVDEDTNEIDFIMLCAPASASSQPSMFIFTIDLIHKQNQLGIAESDCLAACFSLAEPGDIMDITHFEAYCGVLQGKFNVAELIEETTQGVNVKLLKIRPTLIEREEPVDPRFVRALKALQTGQRVPLLAPSSTASNSSARSDGTAPDPERCEYPGISKSIIIADSGQAIIFRGKKGGSTEVAIKIFKGDKQALAAYKDELKALLKLGEHRNVIAVMDFFETPRPCLVMRYVEGGTLWDSIEKRSEGKKPFTLDEAMQIALGMTEGIAHLHANGILHRDLKSLNVLLENGKTPIIIDLGLGKRLDDFSTHAQAQQHTVMPKGTLFWLAPEMVTTNSYSDKTDIYALGILLFEVFACARPYEDSEIGATMLVFLNKIAAGQLRPKESRLQSYTPTFIKDLMRQCWSTEPRDRPSIVHMQKVIKSNGAEALNPFEVFCHFAGGASKGLDHSTFSKCLGRLAPITTEVERQLLFEVMDNDKNGTVDWEEFREWWKVIEHKGIHFAISVLDKPVPEHHVMTQMLPEQTQQAAAAARRPSIIGGPAPAAQEARKPPMLARAMSNGLLAIEKNQTAQKRPVTVKEVTDWLGGIGLDVLIPVFEKEGVDGDGLESINEMTHAQIVEFFGTDGKDIKRGIILKLKRQVMKLYSAPETKAVD